ncbi:transcriptional adapter 2-beta-like isoform X2 [Anneissia japonica]|uniref:transcriptional adapter 2-beta-like isoform X2 n=1 Tax=Anneissia japonica TaxID=1529436 RepID=UPI001425AB5A|nr:transcriptional adapter 2-beta-like isoform X2 [Anneissia japonica]
MAESSTKFYCNYCQDELRGVRVKCIECLEADFDLCLQCFSAGAEIGTHLKTHDYEVLDNGALPLMYEDWSSREEMKLLEAIESYGFGNWEGIANNIGTKTAKQAMEHYTEFLVNGNIGQVTIPTSLDIKVKDHTGPIDGPLSPSLRSSLKPVEMLLEEQQQLGFMPLRDDFEREYENEAEKIVSQLQINLEDDELDAALRFAHVDMYTKVLKERQRRKQISREYSLVNELFASSRAKQQTPKKKMSKEESELREKMREFCQFQKSKDHEELFENMQREKELKARIKELIRYRRNGITKLEECKTFDAARFKRDKRKDYKKKLAEKNAGKRTTPKKEIKEEKNTKNGREIAEDEFQAIKSSHGFNYLSEREKKVSREGAVRRIYYQLRHRVCAAP